MFTLSRTCDRCADVAAQVDDAKLNKEIFDVRQEPTKEEAKKEEVAQEEERIKGNNVCDTPKFQRRLRQVPPLLPQGAPSKEELLVALERRDASRAPALAPQLQPPPPPPPRHYPKPSAMPAIRENIPSAPRLRQRVNRKQLQEEQQQQQRQQEQLQQETAPPPLLAGRSRSHEPASRSGMARDRSSSSRRRFDSVRNLLEKARSILLFTRSKRDRSGSRRREGSPTVAATTAATTAMVAAPPCTPAVTRRREEEEENAISFAHAQSSPNTPLPGRRRSRSSNRSFSPVRALLNSPLLRRKKKHSIDSSEEELLNTGVSPGGGEAGEEGVGDGGVDTEREGDEATDCRRTEEEEAGGAPRGSYRDLETFQKQQLRQKVR